MLDAGGDDRGQVEVWTVEHELELVINGHPLESCCLQDGLDGHLLVLPTPQSDCVILSVSLRIFKGKLGQLVVGHHGAITYEALRIAISDFRSSTGRPAAVEAYLGRIITLPVSTTSTGSKKILGIAHELPHRVLERREDTTSPRLLGLRQCRILRR